MAAEGGSKVIKYLMFFFNFIFFVSMFIVGTDCEICDNSPRSLFPSPSYLTWNLSYKLVLGWANLCASNQPVPVVLELVLRKNFWLCIFFIQLSWAPYYYLSWCIYRHFRIIYKDIVFERVNYIYHMTPGLWRIQHYWVYWSRNIAGISVIVSKYKK